MALTSNIHFNLTPWASGAFTAGQRCASAGNAYQCTTAGNSTAGPTGTGNAVNNGGSAVFAFLSTVDYTSIQDWNTASAGTLTQPIVAAIWNDAPITTAVGVPLFVVSGHVTSPTNTITIRPARASEDFRATLLNNPSLPLAFNTNNGVSFVLPATGVGGINYISIADDNVFLQGLQFQDPNPTSGSTITDASQNCTFSQCIFDGYGQPGGAYIVSGQLNGAASSVLSYQNCLFVDRAPVAATDGTFYTNYTTVIANCTFQNVNGSSQQGAVNNDGGSAAYPVTITNSAFLNYSAGSVLFNNNASAIVQNYCLFSSPTISSITPGTGNVYNVPPASVFIDPVANFRIQPMSPSIKAGIVDTTDVPSAVDILGNPRGATWDIGASQFAVAGSIGTIQAQASVAGVSQSGSVGRIQGQASVAGLSHTASQSVGTIQGQANVAGVSTANISIGTIQAQASVNGYGTGAVTATLSLNNPGQQTVGQSFPVSGSLSLKPLLLFADDGNSTFSPVPESGISSLGSTGFSFVHPPISTVGTQNLLAEDLATAAAAAVNYDVVAAPPPPKPPPPITFPPFEGNQLTSLAFIIPAYLYQEYADDDNVRAFFDAYNFMAQKYLDWFNLINLPIYTGPLISGALLDWVAEGVYGIARPTLSLVTAGPSVGDFNSYDLNSLDINSGSTSGSDLVVPVTDDIFKRILTWYLYKGDGRAFTVFWLKRRVIRFLAGVNGTDYQGPTDQVSVAFAKPNVVNITLNQGIVPNTAAVALQAAVQDQVVPLPFQYVFNVLISNGTTAVTYASDLNYSSPQNSIFNAAL